MATTRLYSVQAVDSAKADAIKSGIVITEGIVNLPEASLFKGKFLSKTETKGKKEILVPVIDAITYTDKADGKVKIFFKAVNQVKDENGKSYEAGVPFEPVRETLEKSENLTKVYDFRTTAKSEKGRVYMEMVEGQ